MITPFRPLSILIHPLPALKPLPACPKTELQAVWTVKNWLVCLATVLLALGFAFQMVYASIPATVSINPKSALLAPSLQTVIAPEQIHDTAMPADFHRRALNALLVPLMDDDEPPRWTDNWMNFECRPNTTVTVDGKPFVARKRIPPVAFTVRWNMDGCTPLGREAMELSGGVELLVFHEDDGLSAIVTPTRFRVDSYLGQATLQGPFTAQMSLAKSATTRP